MDTVNRLESVKGHLAHRVRRVSELEERVAELEAEVQENRQLNRRLAELTDVVMELLLPAADRDDEAVAAIVERYRADIGDPLRQHS